MAITKKIRFEVFKRDSFQCKYCGRSAPGVILEIDHINPKSKGGKDSIFNLITSCFDCNRGKGKRKLSDTSEIKKQKKELEKIQKEREQLKFLKKWREEIKDVDKEYLQYFNDILEECGQYTRTLNENGKKDLLRLIKKYDKKTLITAIDTSFKQYFKKYDDDDDDDDDDETSKSWGKAFDYIEKIICSKKAQEKNPALKNIYYCRSILRNRFSYLNEWQAKAMLGNLLKKYSFKEIKNLCCKSKHWTNFKEDYHDLTMGDNLIIEDGVIYAKNKTELMGEND